LVARYIGKYIPGNPTVSVSNMPGAAGLVLANHIYNVAAQDGTQIGAIHPGAVLEQLLGDKSRAKLDPLKYGYVGNAGTDTFMCLARLDAPVKKFEDVFSTELILGASADGGPTSDVPTVTKAVLGAKYKIIKGYPGSREIMLALEKGEVQGACVVYSTIVSLYPDMLKTGASPFGRILVQEDSVGIPEFNKAGVPLSVAFAKTADERAALGLSFGQNELLRPFVTGPDVPADRLAALRMAFADTMRDPQYLEEARKFNPVVNWSTGEELLAIVKRLYATPPAVVERVRRALDRDK
jgi:hypothetical protein